MIALLEYYLQKSVSPPFFFRFRNRRSTHKLQHRGLHDYQAVAPGGLMTFRWLPVFRRQRASRYPIFSVIGQKPKNTILRVKESNESFN